jgi:DNA segregation ATPase FtsK/SpoIIIE-like protein
MTDYLLMMQAFEYVRENKNITHSSLQRKFRISYQNAARAIDYLLNAKLIENVEHMQRVWKVVEGFECAWCEMAGEESAYPVAEFGSLCGDIDKPICTNCYDDYLDVA